MSCSAGIFQLNYNAAYDLIGKHDQSDDVALYQAYPDGRRETYTFADLDRRSDQLANALAERGVGRGDRVGVVLPQIPANPITHFACWKLGAISMSLSVLFGPDGLGYRLDDSGAIVAVVDGDSYETIRAIEDDCPALGTVLEVEWRGEGGASRWIDGVQSGSRRGGAFNRAGRNES